MWDLDRNSSESQGSLLHCARVLSFFLICSAIYCKRFLQSYSPSQSYIRYTWCSMDLTLLFDVNERETALILARIVYGGSSCSCNTCKVWLSAGTSVSICMPFSILFSLMPLPRVLLLVLFIFRTAQTSYSLFLEEALKFMGKYH